ncbi:MAG: precorrin-6A reductase [Desulfurispora sp.]|uniref:precorrin-6A reductase n=1 Tax=Desulfurispora sp. TaxID=3014275 RepID=UPI00404B9C1E
MLLLICGTGESFALISFLQQHGYQVAALPRTGYGGQLASRADLVLESWADGLKLLEQGQVTAVIDATHPSNGEQVQMLTRTAADSGIAFCSFQRQETPLPESPLVVPVYSWEEAVQQAAAKSGNIFLTTGSHNLELFVKAPQLKGRRIIVRVLPQHQIIKKCQDLGILPRDIVAMQGPFSARFNQAIFQAYRAGVVVTRDSGTAGGTENKIKAARALQIPVILIKRTISSSPQPAVYTPAELLDWLARRKHGPATGGDQRSNPGRRQKPAHGAEQGQPGGPAAEPAGHHDG